MKPRRDRPVVDPQALRLATAIAAAAFVILSSPFVGELRAAIQSGFPQNYRLIVVGIVLASAALLVLAALVRIRDDRGRRYAALGAAVSIAATCALAFRTGDANVDAVEAFHFVEYGVVTLLFYRVWRSSGDLSTIVFPLLAGIIVGALDEWLQWFIPFRAGEIRDVFINGIASGCGVLFSVAVDPPGGPVWTVRAGGRTKLGGCLVATLLLVAGFFSTAHLGSEVRDPEIGVFRSRETVAGLESASRSRTERWQEHPPLVQARVGREDQYFSEALWHVRRRNEAASHGDADTAWRENRIVEKFYEPVLDTPSYAGATGQRWPDEQREEMAAKRGIVDMSFVSDANPYPIYVWPKMAFWTTVASLSCVLLGLGAWADRRTFERNRYESLGTSL